MKNPGIVGAIGLSGIILFLCFFADRNEGYLIGIMLVVGAFCWYTAIHHLHLSWAVGIGISLRLAACFSVPLLSDDYFRFIWDGELWLAGIHPLNQLPTEVSATFADRHATLLQEMNSAGYFTVYPPLSQAVFALSAWLGKTIFAQVVTLKIFLFIAELGVLRLLYLLCKDSKNLAVAAYALHPLAIVEICGNGHFEGFALLGILLAVYGFRQNDTLLGGLGIAVGFLVKLVPLLLAPAIALAWLFSKPSPAGKFSFPALDFRRLLNFSASLVALSLLGFVVFLYDADLSGFGESLDLYFRKFEFNGSIYPLASTLGKWYEGWNWIAVVGPGLSIISFLTIMSLSIFRSFHRLNLEETLLWSMAAYLAFATTVHPWYAIYLVGIGSLTRYTWPYLLGFTVFLSYVAYGQNPVEVPPFIALLEWGSVALYAAYEVNKLRLPTLENT